MVLIWTTFTFNNTALETIDILREMFPDRVISRRGDQNSPLRSRDLTQCDVFLWGHVKYKVYAKSLASTQYLKDGIREAIEDVRQPETMLFIAVLLLLLLDAAKSMPADVAASGSEDVTVPKLFSFDNGNIGVNFLGFRAAAGLGGLLMGNAADGGLHAEAGTPFGQAAKAGLGGSVNGQGRAAGGLYADATAGGGVGAGAGLAGRTGSEGSIGTSYSGASAGVFSNKRSTINPAIGLRGNFEASADGNLKVVKEKVVEVQPQFSYVEKEIVPKYQEKTVYVPGYVEKTVRIPTITEQKVKVPVPPTYVEKEVNVQPSYVKYDSKIHQVEHGTTIYQKTKIRTHPHFREHIWLGGAHGFDGAYNGANDAGYTGTYNSVFKVRKTANPQLINDIFNIPISTLTAVNKLVGGIVGGTSGSVEVSKSLHAHY